MFLSLSRLYINIDFYKKLAKVFIVHELLGNTVVTFKLAPLNEAVSAIAEVLPISNVLTSVYCIDPPFHTIITCPERAFEPDAIV